MNLATGTCRLSQTVQTDSATGWTFSDTKTHRSRTFHLPGFVIDALRTLRAEQATRRLKAGDARVDHDLVVDRGDGNPLNPWPLSQRFAYATKKAGLDVCFHDLRHGNATPSLAAGVALTVTSRRLGHSSIAITSDVYSGVADDTDRAAADALDSFVGGVLS